MGDAVGVDDSDGSGVALGVESELEAAALETSTGRNSSFADDSMRFSVS